MICAPLLLLKTLFQHNSMQLMLQYIEQQHTEVGQHHTKGFNSYGTELC